MINYKVFFDNYSNILSNKLVTIKVRVNIESNV